MHADKRKQTEAASNEISRDVAPLRLSDSAFKKSLAYNDPRGRLVPNIKKLAKDSVLSYSFVKRGRSKEKKVKCVNIVRNVKLKNVDKAKKHLHESTFAERNEL